MLPNYTQFKTIQINFFLILQWDFVIFLYHNIKHFGGKLNFAKY